MPYAVPAITGRPCASIATSYAYSAEPSPPNSVDHTSLRRRPALSFATNASSQNPPAGAHVLSAAPAVVGNSNESVCPATTARPCASTAMPRPASPRNVLQPPR